MKISKTTANKIKEVIRAYHDEESFVPQQVGTFIGNRPAWLVYQGSGIGQVVLEVSGSFVLQDGYCKMYDANGCTLAVGTYYLGLLYEYDVSDYPVFIVDGLTATIQVGATSGSPLYSGINKILVDQSTGLQLTNPSSGVANVAISLIPPAVGGTGTSAVPVDGALLIGNGTTGVYSSAPLTAGTGIATTTGAGTLTINNTGVTSVGMTVPSWLAVTPSVITTTGTFAVSATNEAAFTALMGPTTTTAGSAPPTFRLLVSSDIPSLDVSKITTGILPIARGGTNTNGTPANGKLLIGNGIDYSLANITAGTGITVTNAAGSITVANTGVTSVAMSVPSWLSVSGPVTSSGTLAVTAISETPNQVLAGPATGTVSGVPAFRALVAADVPALPYVTSVGLTMPSIFSVGSSPVSSSGTIGVTLANEAANFVLAGPTTGSPATPTFRALVAADIPFLPASQITTGTFLSAQIPTVNLTTMVSNILPIANGGTAIATTPTNGKLLIGNGVGYAVANLTAGSGVTITNAAGTITIAASGGAGTVTSVGLSMPSGFSVASSPITTGGTLAVTTTLSGILKGTGSGFVAATPGTDYGSVSSVGLTAPSWLTVASSPITTSGTIALSGTPQTANTHLAGPASGSAAAPAFRAIVPADLGSGSATSSTYLRGDQTWAAVSSSPTGAVTMYAASSPPSGWLACDGSAVSRSSYSALFSIVGTTWGVGDGSTTFNVPDMRSRSPIGNGTGTGLTNRVLATTGGTETHTLSSGEMPSHSHAPPSSHLFFTQIAGGASGVTFGAGGTSYFAESPTATTGGGAAHANMHPWLAMSFIIKT